MSNLLQGFSYLHRYMLLIIPQTVLRAAAHGTCMQKQCRLATDLIGWSIDEIRIFSISLGKYAIQFLLYKNTVSGTGDSCSLLLDIWQIVSTLCLHYDMLHLGVTAQL